ncbi:MAG: glycosyltransferase family 4 protein [Chitinophagaceae bacterium]
MKVLIIHSSYKYKGGEDTVVAEELKLLQSNGVTVELLLFNNESSTLTKVLQLPFNIKSYSRTIKKLNTFQPDVVHIHNLHFAASASIVYAIKKYGVPFVVTLHNYRLLCPSAILFNRGKPFLDSLKQNFPWNAVKQGVYKDSKLLTFWISFSMQIHHWMNTWKMSNRFIVLTQHAKDIFLKSRANFTDDQILIKPNFCSIPSQVTFNTSPSDYFLYVGRLSEEKGISLLLETFAASRYKIKIAGDGPLLNEVKYYCSQFPNIEYIGVLEKSRIFDLLNNCTALVFPSIWYEGMPLTIIEAFASGAPVIATRLGAMESMISNGYNGLHFEVGNSTDLKAQLDKWQNFDSGQKEAYRKNARKTYEEFYTPERNFEQLLSIYTDVIKEAKKQPTKNLLQLGQAVQ